MSRMIMIAILLVSAAGPVHGGEKTPAADKGVSLAQLTRAADLVVLAQVRDTEYTYRREFPVNGSAYLKVLIAYKAEKAPDMIEVFEHGLHPHECYFPNPTAFAEGRRYLLFLKNDAHHPGRYRGLAQGCALDVLVGKDNRYVLRLPVTGIQLSDPLGGLARKFEFADAYAVETDQSLPPRRRDALLAGGWIVRDGDRYIYTRGVELSIVHKLMAEHSDSTTTPK